MPRKARSEFLAPPEPPHGPRQVFPAEFDIPPLTTDVSALLSYTRPSSVSSSHGKVAVVKPIQNNALDTLSFAASQAASSDLQLKLLPVDLDVSRKHVKILPRVERRPNPPLEPGPTRKPRKQCTICKGYFANLSTHNAVHISKDFRSHACHACGRKFSRLTDLNRHERSHRAAVFKCPLYYSQPLGRNRPQAHILTSVPGCHQSGCFSRGDTYKNHLKSMHFEYPPGTRKRDRRVSAGKCKACGQDFENTDTWISSHIDNGSCGVIQSIARAQDQTA